MFFPAALTAQVRVTVPRGDASRTMVTQADFDSTLLGDFAWRPIGPAITSGRIVDLAVPEGPADRILRPGQLIYAASASGGVWKTENEGTTWIPVFDKYGSSSIGDIAVARTNPDIIWVGTGESNNQRSSSWGDGVYKSENGGKTWTNMGLRSSQHIGRIVIHPVNPNVVFVAAVGPLWTSGGERGLFKTTDGGKTWKAVIRISPHTGVTDVIMESGNPDVMYAASFQRQRKAYSFVGGGPESGIYKSTDGGENWIKLNEGLPKVPVGRIGLDVSQSRPGTVYATMENKGAEIYRSDDYGASWRKMGNGRSYPWYMGQVRVDPRNPDRIYHLGVQLQVSEDGGKTFRNTGTSAHSDHHALWIDPNDSDHFINGNDGGVYITRDRGRTMDWSPNLPVSQYYAIATDMREPYYYVYGGLQDNGSWAGPSRTRNRQGITNGDWYRTTGGDGFQAAIDPTDHNVVYGEWQEGSILRYDVRTGEEKTIKPEPAFGERKFRWNWSSPILVSPHDHNTIYFGANFLFKSTSRGDAWERLGGDLTRQLNRDSLPLMGKVWKKDAVARHAGVADFGNISTIDESPLRKGLLYVGTDDGLVQVTRDDGKTWEKISKFPGVPGMAYVSRVVASRHAEGTAYVTLDNHRSNDFIPYVLKSMDYGKSWRSISANLPRNGSVHVVREHPRTSALLFVGTEFGAFYSSNGGAKWSKLPNNLPTVAVHDIVIHPRENDLVIGTHGRGIYILDDITPLERMAEASAAGAVYLFPAKTVTLYNENASFPGGRGAAAEGERTFAAPNPAFGSTLTYFLRDSLGRGEKLALAIFDSAGNRVRDITASGKKGMHRVTWDLRLPLSYAIPKGTSASQQPRGSFVLPGRYVAKLSLSGRKGIATMVSETVIDVRPDPLVRLSAGEYGDLHQMRIRASQAQAAVQAAIMSGEQLKLQVGQAKAALRNFSGGAALEIAVSALELEVDSSLARLRVAEDSTERGADIDDKTRSEPTVRDRVNDVAEQIGGVTSPPTRLQRETLDRAIADLKRETGTLNNVIFSRMPALNQKMDAAGVPWSIGRPVQILK